MSGREQLADLDLLRLIAIILVVGRVVVESAFTPPTGSQFANALLVVGLLGVGVFFFISGYLLQRGYPSISTIAEARLFFNRRAWRIAPLYWVALAVTLLLPATTERGIGAGDAIAHVPGLQMVFYPEYISVLLLWFVSVIIVYYLLYPILVYRRPPLLRLLLRAGAIFALIGAVKAVTGLFGGQIFEYLPVFVLGVAAGSIDFLRVDRYRRLRLLLAIGALPAIAAAYLSHTDIAALEAGGGLPLTAVLMAVGEIGFRLVAMLCFVFLVREAYILLAPQVLGVVRLVGAGATASYAAYLFHAPWLAAIRCLVGSPPTAMLVVSLISLPVLFVVCYYIQTAADRLTAPFRRPHTVERNG